MATTTSTTTDVETAEHIKLSPLPRDAPVAASAPKPRASGDGESEDGMGRAMYLKVISAGFSFFVAGVNDGSIGALIPYVIREYDISTAIVSSV